MAGAASTIASDGNDRGAGSSVAGVSEAALFGEATTLAMCSLEVLAVHRGVGDVHIAHVALREGGAALLTDA